MSDRPTMLQSPAEAASRKVLEDFRRGLKEQRRPDQLGPNGNPTPEEARAKLRERENAGKGEKLPADKVREALFTPEQLRKRARQRSNGG